jgi:hypothetical protein
MMALRGASSINDVCHQSPCHSERWQDLRDSRSRAAALLDACSDVLRSNLRYRLASMHGNPWLRLLRREAEDFVAVLAYAVST